MKNEEIGINERSNIKVEATSHPKELVKGSKGFGQYFTDHMFKMFWTEKLGWHHPVVVPYQKIEMDPAACILHYSQGLFEGLKAYYQPQHNQVAIFRPLYNVQRMNQGAQRLCMPTLPELTVLSALRELIKIDSRWVPKDRGAALYVRPTLIGTESFLGVRPAKEYLFFIILSPVDNYYASKLKKVDQEKVSLDGAVRIWAEKKYVRASKGGLGGIKACANYASTLLASQEAKQKGYDQVLWLDSELHQFAEEVGTMNVFFVFDSEIVTPPLAGTILPGCVRDSSITLLKAMGYQVTERNISLEEIYQRFQKSELKEIFGTGTAAVISPLRELSWEGHKIELETSPHSISFLLKEKILDIQHGITSDTHDWMLKIPLS